MHKAPLLKLITLALCTATSLACTTSSGPKAHSLGPASSYVAQGALPDEIDPGTLKVWLGQPHHVLGLTMIPVYRGTPRDIYSTSWLGASTPSSLATTSSKIRWSNKASHLAQINYMIPQATRALPLFSTTPQSVVELAFLAPAEPAPPAPEALVIELNDQSGANKAQLHVNAPPAPTPNLSPTFHNPAQQHPNLSAQLPHWELPGLNQTLVLACVVIDQTPSNAPADAKRVYRGQLWIKPPIPEAPPFVHKDDKLEPSSWHLRPDDSAKLEVVMSDRDGWPQRVDLIDLNTLTATTLVDMASLQDANVQ